MASLITQISNEKLLDTFVLMVRADHYDPVETDPKVVGMRQLGVTTDSLRQEIIRRMEA